MPDYAALGIPPTGSTQNERFWLGRHAGHPIYHVKSWRSVIALAGGPGELWACDCKGDGDRQWFHAVEP